MKKSSSLLLAGLCAAGLLCGFATRRLSAGHATNSTAREISPRGPASTEKADSPESTATRTPGRSAPAEIPHRRSADTLETLLAVPDSELYTRLAAWLSDASEPDIAAFWKSYGPRKGRSNDITDLVFLNWTRLDPRAALAGSSNDHHAWWAWGCHDPKGALAAAAESSPGSVKNVAWGIGEFHPEWLREHFKELSEDAQDFALRGMEKWDDGQDPLAAMKFLKEVGRSVTKGTFQALIRQDPWAALDWAKENPGSEQTDFGDPMELIVATLASDRPDDLERLAAQTPSGAAKLKMESALFANLLKTDPEAALQAAKETTAPRAAAERFAAIGLGVVKTNPEQAFGLAKELLTKCPNALGMMAMVEYPGGSSGHGMEIPGVQDFLLGLMAKDPARTLEMTTPAVASLSGSSPFYHLASSWAQRDLVAYTNWVNRQTDPAVHDSAASIVINNLQQQGNYGEAIDWVLSQKATPDNDGVINLLYNWKRQDAAAATAWLEAANLPEASKTKIRSSLDRMN